MDTAGYIGLSRQIALFRKMDAISNNIANVNTDGYKAQFPLFEEHLSHAGNNNAEPSSFVFDTKTVTNFEQGDLRATGRPLDAAIEGEGFFALDTPLGTRYTRSGSFHVDAEGQLVTKDNYVVQGDGGAILLDPSDVEISIKEDGTVSVKNPSGETEVRGTIAVVKFSENAKITKLGNSLFASNEAASPAVVGDDFQVAGAMVEASNVNSVLELTEMVKVSRAVGGAKTLMDSVHDMQRNAVKKISSQQ